MMPLEIKFLPETSPKETVFVFENVLFTNMHEQAIKAAKYLELLPYLQYVAEKHDYKVKFLQNQIICFEQELNLVNDKLISLIKNN